MFNFVNNISPIELVAIGLILIVVFGAGVVKRLAKTSGESFKEIKNIKKTFTEAVEDSDDKSAKDKN